MTKRLLKIFLISILILGFCITYVSASDINLNLPENNNEQVDANTTTDNNTANPENVDNPDLNSQSDNSTSDGEAQTLQPTAVKSNSEGLSVTNIINILLITVGVILILLAIAIIIRLK